MSQEQPIGVCARCGSRKDLAWGRCEICGHLILETSAQTALVPVQHETINIGSGNPLHELQSILYKWGTKNIQGHPVIDAQLLK